MCETPRKHLSNKDCWCEPRLYYRTMNNIYIYEHFNEDGSSDFGCMEQAESIVVSEFMLAETGEGFDPETFIARNYTPLWEDEEPPF